MSESQTASQYSEDEIPFRCERDCGTIIEFRDTARFNVDGEWCCAVCARDDVPAEFEDAFGDYFAMMDEVQNDERRAIKFTPGTGSVTTLFLWRDDEWKRVQRRRDHSGEYYWSGEWAKENHVLDALANAQYQDKDYEWDWATPPQVVDIAFEKDTEGIKDAV